MGDGLHYDGDKSSSDDESSELQQAASEAFPDQDWTSERLDSLKTLMKLCMDDYGGGDETEEPDDKHAGLALLFGGPKKK